MSTSYMFYNVARPSSSLGTVVHDEPVLKAVYADCRNAITALITVQCMKTFRERRDMIHLWRMPMHVVRGVDSEELRCCKANYQRRA